MRHFLPAFLVVLLLTGGATAWAAPAAPMPSLNVAGVLQQVRRATGYGNGQAAPTNFVLNGGAHYSGVDEQYHLQFAPSGQFAEKYTGSFPQVTGFDGRTGWTVDYSGMPHILELENLETAQMADWIETGRWLAQDSPFIVSLVPDQTNTQQVALSLHFKTGVLEARLVIDRTSWLPQTLVYSTVYGDEVWHYDDYREEAGRVLARHWTHQIGSLTNTITIHTVRKATDTSAAPYTPVTTKPDDTTFDLSLPPQVEAKTSEGFLLVHPRVNGKDVGWFYLDTGTGAMMIDSKVADSLGMTPAGEAPEYGIGATFKTARRQGKTFQLGPLTVKNLAYEVWNFGPLSAEPGKRIAGICGYDVLCRAITEIDISAGAVALYDPPHYALTQGQWKPLTLSDRVPAVRCRFEGDREGIFTLDTGSPNTVDFLTPAVQKWHLLQRTTQPSGIGGLGGASPLELGHLDWFELAGHRFQNPQVGFSEAQRGAYSDSYNAGNIGQGFLKSFQIIFDYPDKKIAFVEVPKKTP